MGAVKKLEKISTKGTEESRDWGDKAELELSGRTRPAVGGGDCRGDYVRSILSLNALGPRSKRERSTSDEPKYVCLSTSP